MARINIEESWWTSPRRDKLARLVGSKEMADGIAVGFWRVAQEYWGGGRKPIPAAVFDLIEANAKLIEANLAIVQADGVYAIGAEDSFDWVAKRRDAAKKGGQKSAERPRNAKGQLTKTPKQNPTTNEAKSKSIQASDSDSDSDSDSGSGSGEIKFPSETQKTEFRVNELIASYCERFKSRYGTNPEIQGKDRGIASRLVKNLTRDKAELYLDAYFAMPDAWLVKTRHPLAAFEAKLNEVVVFARTGNFQTQKQTRQADDQVSIQNMLRRVREGTL